MVHTALRWFERVDVHSQLFEAETADPSFRLQLLAALVTDAMTALDADMSSVEQPDELLTAPGASLRCVVLVTAYHSSHPQLTHLPPDLTVDHNNATRYYCSQLTGTD